MKRGQLEEKERRRELDTYKKHTQGKFIASERMGRRGIADLRGHSENHDIRDSVTKEHLP